ncbi:MAG: 2-oxo acid dehydrogenase subunit E2, partial [Legionellales bacterium]|nr:2-oxo acid dehydrogenase subunit E2 [Legionellales bacterium]
TEDAIFPPDFTFNDITVQIIKAIIKAITVEPNLNSWFFTNSMGIKTFSDVNLGIAMDTQEGLFVPVIPKAQNLSDAEIRNKINKYKVDVKARTIDPNVLKNLTITLSNFGSISGKYANPIVVPPSVAIVGIGKIRDVITPINNKPEICKMLPISLTFDHRAITGGESARFLGAFISALTNN